MGKAPAFQFYPNDWARDLEEHPLEIEGAWIRICCKLWWAEPKGKLTRTLEQWAKVLRVDQEKAGNALKYIFEQKIGDISYNGNGEVTVISRRMYNDNKDRELNMLRQRRFKDKRRSNASVTVESRESNGASSSSSSSSSSLKDKKEKNKHIAKVQKTPSPDVKTFIDFYYKNFEETFSQPPLIEGGKDGSIVKALLREIPLLELNELMLSFLDSQDPFIQKSGYTLGVFKSQINKLRIGEQKINQPGLASMMKKIVQEEEDEKRRSEAICVGDGQDIRSLPYKAQ